MLASPPLAQLEPVSHRRTPQRTQSSQGPKVPIATRPQQPVCVRSSASCSRRAAAVATHIERHARSPTPWHNEHWGVGFTSRAPLAASSPLRVSHLGSTRPGAQSAQGLSVAYRKREPRVSLGTADMEDLSRGLEDMNRRRQGFLRSSGGQVGPGRRQTHQKKKCRPTMVEAHPRAHQYGRGLPSTKPGIKPLPFWQASREMRDHVPMHDWLRSKENSGDPSPAEVAGFQLDRQEAHFADCVPDIQQELVVMVRNATSGPLRVRLRRKPATPAFTASLMFPTGTPVASGLAAHLQVTCHGGWIRSWHGGCEDWLELEVEGRRQRLVLKLRASVPSLLPQTRRDAERQQAMAEVASLPSSM